MTVNWTLVVGAHVVALITIWLVDRLLHKKQRSPLAVLPGPESDHWLFGNLKAINGPESTQYMESLVEKYGGVVKTAGFAGTADRLLISDPEALHSIFISNTDVWLKPGVSNSINNMLFGPGVVTVSGEAHRRQRKTLTPIFSTQQMRKFLPSFWDISRTLCKKIKSDMETCGSNDMKVDILRLTSQTALDIVGTSAIGYNFDTINSDSEYSQAVKQLFATMSELTPFIIFFPLLAKLGPWSFRKWVMDLILPRMGRFGNAAMRYNKIIEVMDQKSSSIYGEKWHEVRHGGEDQEDSGGPKDVISSLIQGSQANSEDALEAIEIVSQIQTMVFAGHETTSTALTRSLQILSQDTAMQEKLRLEFSQARSTHGDGDLDYDAILSLPFLDAFVREVLRMYPPLAIMARETSKDTILPFHTPIKTPTGQYIKQVPVPKGTFVILGISAANKNEAIFGEDAKQFKPERWLSTKGDEIGTGIKNASVYSGLLTFSGGFRSCLGFKFAVLEIKVVLYSLLSAFAFSAVHAEKDLTWKTAIGLFPVVRGEEEKGPQLPLKVTAL